MSTDKEVSCPPRQGPNGPSSRGFPLKPSRRHSIHCRQMSRKSYDSESFKNFRTERFRLYVRKTAAYRAEKRNVSLLVADRKDNSYSWPQDRRTLLNEVY